MKHYKRGFINYVPELFLPRFKPVIIDDIVKDDTVIGKVVGINLKPIDISKKSDLQAYINAIKKIITEEYSRLFIEGLENYNEEILIKLQESLNMKIVDGESIRISNLSFAMENIYRFLKDNSNEKEVLILCDNKEMTKRIIKEIAKSIRFVTVSGCDKDSNEEIYEYILEETGLSLFYPYDIQRIIEHYNIIINLLDNVNLDFSKIRKNCIIFDLSKNKVLSNKRFISIDDFGFHIKDMGINGNKWINNKISSGLYESLIGCQKHNIKYLIIKNQYYLIKDYVNSCLRMKGRL